MAEIEIVAVRNLRSFIKRAIFKDETSREAANTCVDVLASALSSKGETPEDEWQTMDSAPKDGTKFDVWVPDAFGGYRMTDLSLNQKGKLRQNGLLTEADLPRWPTHWRHRPAAPKDKEDAK